jgi:ribosomal protein L20A (L18A)
MKTQNKDHKKNEIKVKIFNIQGLIVKPQTHITFKKTIMAVSKDDAMEKLFSDIGSKHKAKRFQIKIIKTEEEQN